MCWGGGLQSVKLDSCMPTVVGSHFLKRVQLCSLECAPEPNLTVFWKTDCSFPGHVWTTSSIANRSVTCYVNQMGFKTLHTSHFMAWALFAAPGPSLSSVPTASSLLWGSWASAPGVHSDMLFDTPPPDRRLLLSRSVGQWHRWCLSQSEVPDGQGTCGQMRLR